MIPTSRNAQGCNGDRLYIDIFILPLQVQFCLKTSAFLNAIAMHRDAMAMHRDTIAMHRDTITMHRDTIAMHRDTITMHRDAMAMHRDAMAMQGMRNLIRARIHQMLY